MMASPAHWRRYDMVRIPLCALLLGAAALKAQELVTGSPPDAAFFRSRWLEIAAIDVESALGLSLLLRFWPRRIWTISFVCFAVFGCISLYRTASGSATCGCFGTASTSPLISFLID